MLDQAWHVRFRFHLSPHQVTGDTTYGTIENSTALAWEGIHAYLPLPDWEQRTPYFGLRQFIYDVEHDVYMCPQGYPLRFLHTDFTTARVAYRGDAAICNACPVKVRCTASDHGRLVHRNFAESYLDRVRLYHQGEPYAKAMRKRKVWVEPLFAEGKQWHGMRRFRLRNLWRVNSEALLIAAAKTSSACSRSEAGAVDRSRTGRQLRSHAYGSFATCWRQLRMEVASDAPATSTCREHLARPCQRPSGAGERFSTGSAPFRYF